jgi:hypothetical protein
MPIIIDNFQVNIDAPIDNRFVVGGTNSFYSNRDLIKHKYQGLRIWDLTPNNSGPYYWTGATWSSENSVGVLVDGTTEQNYIPRFTGTTVLGKSLLYQNTSFEIGIGLTNSINTKTDLNGNVIIGSPTSGLHTNGNIKTNGHLIGRGSHIKDLNATNVSSGLLDIKYISNQSGGSNLTPGQYILSNTGITNGVAWTLTNTLSVLNSKNTEKVNITEDNTSPQAFITFVQSATGDLPIKTNSSKMQFKPSNGQLFLSDGSATEPVYSFLNSTNTGMYYDGYNIGFTKQGNNWMTIIDNGIAVKSPQYPQIQFIETTTNKNRLLWVGMNDDLLFRTETSNSSTDKRVWHQDNLFTLKSLGDKSVETDRNLNISITNAGTNDLIKGVYTYNVYDTTIQPSAKLYWSVISFGRGDKGSVQLASNWTGKDSEGGNVYAERDILLRSLRDTGESWSPWVKIWNSGNSGYVPFGSIIMWSGLTTQIPTGWRLCDGSPAVTIPAGSVPGQPSITSITIPDLRERFVVGAGIEPSKIIKNYSAPFTISSFQVVAANNTTFTIDTTNAYYLDSTGKLRQGVNIDGYSYHLYKGPGSTTSTGFKYIVFDNRFSTYSLINGALPGVGNSATGNVIFCGDYVPGSTYANGTILTTDGRTIYNQNGDQHVDYTKHFTKGRRVGWREINWQTTTSTGYNVGDKGGQDDVTLLGSQIPKHQHDSTFGEKNSGGTYGNSYDSNGALGSNGGLDGDNKRFLTSAYGNNQAHENRPPFYALAFIIYTGI